MNEEHEKLINIKKDIPPSSRMKETYYQVLICSTSNAYWADGWTPIGNCWGFPYSYKGFAINSARKWISRLTHHSGRVYARVVNISTGEDVWRSENVIKAWGEVDNA